MIDPQKVPSEQATVHTTVLFVATCPEPYRNRCVARLREAGLLPVTVTDIDAALALLRQFSAGAVLLPATSIDNHNWEQCARLIDTGTPVVQLAHQLSDDGLSRLLAAGSAAILMEPWTTEHLQIIMRRVRAGERGIIWPEMPQRAAIST